jgi:hypothetical protein
MNKSIEERVAHAKKRIDNMRDVTTKVVCKTTWCDNMVTPGYLNDTGYCPSCLIMTRGKYKPHYLTDNLIHTQHHKHFEV